MLTVINCEPPISDVDEVSTNLREGHISVVDAICQMRVLFRKSVRH